MSIDFSCRAFGKWILAGEHSVLRGVPALAFPLRSRRLDLSYSTKDQPLEIQLIGEHGKDLQLLVWGVLERACEVIGIGRVQLRGFLLLDSSIPIGAGMGASAALCVAITRWLGYLQFVQEENYYEFARHLENLFHGESSGVDIAVALSGEGLRFVRDGDRRPILTTWNPHWFLSYSGQRGVTVDAVAKVKDLLFKNPALGEKLDRQMAQSVEMAERALRLESSEGLPLLCQAVTLAGTCFEGWGLNEGAPSVHLQLLQQHGASAVKPTGSGGGGYVLSLWEKEPPESLLSSLIPCS